MKQKIKEKLPGGHKEHESSVEKQHEKKGFVEKVKEKMPGHHKE